MKNSSFLVDRKHKLCENNIMTINNRIIYKATLNWVGGDKNDTILAVHTS